MREIHLNDVVRPGLQAVLAKGERLLDPISGIILSVIPNLFEKGDPTIYAYGTVASQSRSFDIDPQINHQGGASAYRDGAIAAAIGEAVERYCSSDCPTEETVFATYNDVAADAVHPSKFGLFSESQYQKPDFHFKPFTTDSPITWAKGYSLQRKRETLVPACLTYLPFRIDRARGETLICNGTSTGLACGNSIEEAICSGIGELVERDALACFWLNRLPLPHIEVDVASSIYKVFKEKFDLPGLRYFICDATTNLGLPVVFTLLVGESNLGRMVNAGSQANPSPQAAALKSMTEAAQGRPYLRFIVQQNPKKEYTGEFSSVNSFQDHAIFYTKAPQHFDALDFLTSPRPTKRLSEMTDCSTGSVRGDIEFYLSQLRKHDIDVIVVDLTTPDIADVGFHVVRVITPGLQLLHGDHRFPFLGGWRLYQVVEALGYQNGLAREEGLNPYPHPLP